MTICWLFSLALLITSTRIPIWRRCVRHSFSKNINRDGINSGGYVRWENDNPQDARIRLHAWADAPNGVSNVSVSEVQGIRQDAI
jgi:hypothetical protein